MTYLPTFSINFGKYTIHGQYGKGPDLMDHQNSSSFKMFETHPITWRQFLRQL